MPHAITLLGHLPLSIFWNPLGFAYKFPAFWKRQPVRLKALFQEIYIIQGAHNFLGLFQERSLSSFFVHRTFLVNAFSLPKEAAKTYLKDDSGRYIKPRPDSKVQHNNRVEFHVRTSQQRILLGREQSSFFGRLDSSITKRLSSLTIGEEWVHISDFLAIFKYDLTPAVVDSVAGPALMQRHPSFAEDIWVMDDNIVGLLLRKPRFLNSQGHQARDRALSAVLNWQNWARQNFTPDAVDEDGSDPFWGSKFFRERQEIFAEMDGFDLNAIASEKLSFIWSVNTNAIMASFWITLEAFRDMELLQAIREEVNPCIQRRPDNRLEFDVNKLVRQPLLQAMFAENIRLRVHGFLLRHADQDGVTINNWKIPGNSLCISNATPASMDPEFWCRGESSAHPVDQFWPGRFLKTDPDTGLQQFSLAGTEGFWIPFGGGPHACPGRFLTKRENILVLALMVTLFDCEVLAPKADIKLKSGVFPHGTVPPQNKIPARLRRRSEFSTIASP